jgi:hypothetical protein
VTTERRREIRLRAQKKYLQTLKGRATAIRYRQTAKGKAAIKRANEKRVIVATRVIYLGTKAQRDQVHAHIQRRRREFVTRFESGAETQSLSAG